MFVMRIMISERETWGMVGGYSNHIVIIVEEGGAFVILHLPVTLTRRVILTSVSYNQAIQKTV